jgi:hypothetical protein
MLRRVALVGTDVSEERSASFIRVTRTGELGTLAVTSNGRTLRRNYSREKLKSHNTLLFVFLQGGKNPRARNISSKQQTTDNDVPTSRILTTLKMEAIRSSETTVLTRSTRRHIPEKGILHSYRSENVISYIALTG